jgi:D-lyxose ketol-isomerase
MTERRFQVTNYQKAPKHDKLWGAEYWLHNGKYCMKVLALEPGFQSSLHYHEKKEETFLVIAGAVVLESPPGVTHLLLPGDFYDLPPLTSHRFWTEDHPALIAEASTHHDDNDVVRLENSREI